MEVYRTKDGQVAKYVHDDGSETAIKTISSCDNTFGEESDKVRNKYSLFVSISVGCFMKCKFCYLTVKNYPFYILEKKDILNNVKEALKAEVENNPELKDKYVKLAWMGMGDAYLYPQVVNDLTIEILDWIMENGYARGFDGVDLATSYPWGAQGFTAFEANPLIGLNKRLSKYEYNPDHNFDNTRSRFRLFYSLHSVDQETRTSLITRSKPVKEAISNLESICSVAKVNLIYHYLFFEGVNDSKEAINELVAFMNEPRRHQHELRVLRFNSCDGSKYKESPLFDIIVKGLSVRVPRLKYQISTGSEIKAACGQFILKDIKRA